MYEYEYDTVVTKTAGHIIPRYVYIKYTTKYLVYQVPGKLLRVFKTDSPPPPNHKYYLVMLTKLWHLAFLYHTTQRVHTRDGSVLLEVKRKEKRVKRRGHVTAE